MARTSPIEDKRPVVLIVDDTPTNIQVLAEGLRNEYRVRVAANGKTALEIIEKLGLPDLILLDVMMPEMDGYEVCKRLKGSLKTQHIPVLFVTAKTDTADEEYGLRLGAVDYIAKPFQMPIVAARVRNHINLKIKTDLLESQALLDGLTDIPNRRRFDDVLNIEWKRAQRTGTSLSLIIADIDYFKLFNDNYGHGVGDYCLKKVAATLADSIERPSDLVARYGGEEFAAILPETDVKGAAIIAERFRTQVENLKIPHSYSVSGSFVTISLGLSCIKPTDGTEPNELLNTADAKLYQAKESGRNKICK